MDERMRRVRASLRTTVKVSPWRIDLELPVAAPFGGDPALPDGDASEDAAEPQLAGVEDPRAVARIKRDDVHAASLTGELQAEVGETWLGAWNLVAVSCRFSDGIRHAGHGSDSDGDDGLEMLHYREGVVEVMQRGAPLLICRRAPKTLCVILQAPPFRQEQEAARSLDAAFDSQRDEARTAGDVGLCFLHRLEKGVFLPGNDLEQRRAR